MNEILIEDIQCPVCGYYCNGKGGFYCINKPALLKFKTTEKTIESLERGMEKFEQALKSLADK